MFAGAALLAVLGAARAEAQAVKITPPASAVTASGDDGNVPGNAVDGNLATRWSMSGDGHWLQLDLGSTKTVAFVKIASYKGDTRSIVFEIQTSSGGGVWETVFSGQSNGTSTGLQTFDFPDKDARWVRYLGHGNTANAWNSLTEVEIWGMNPGGCTAPSGSSALWNQFVQARRNGTEPTLPDFSYAGYKRSDAPIPNVTGPVFDVTSFGATPNNSSFDDAGIQAAINAAQNAGGGVVFFPAGRYLVNPTEDTGEHFIGVTGSNIVLRGAGSGSGGSEIVMVAKKQGGRMFRIGPADGWGATTVANVTAGATRETFEVTVDSAAQLAVGQIVVLKHQSPAYNSFYFAGKPLDPDWTRVVENGAGVHEMHEIASISGNRVRFKEPLHFTIRLDNVAWRLDRVSPLREIGIERLRFTGSWDTWPEAFVHHKDWIHDSGWSLISIRETVYAWLRDVEFRNFNDALGTDSVGWMTAESLRFTGKKGHSSVGGRRGYGMLVKNATDTAGTHHGPDTGYNLVGAVYLRFQMNVNATVDNHGGVPHANLLDDVTGGVLFGNGGPIDNYPHTGRYYTLWNFRHRATASRTYDFWDAVNRNSHT
ncbi:MAG TPA: discoidin domain-containing protein, partial [Vicinamibacteria bacterium]